MADLMMSSASATDEGEEENVEHEELDEDEDGICGLPWSSEELRALFSELKWESIPCFCSLLPPPLSPLRAWRLWMRAIIFTLHLNNIIVEVIGREK